MNDIIRQFERSYEERAMAGKPRPRRIKADEATIRAFADALDGITRLVRKDDVEPAEMLSTCPLPVAEWKCSFNGMQLDLTPGIVGFEFE